MKSPVWKTKISAFQKSQSKGFVARYQTKNPTRASLRDTPVCVPCYCQKNGLNKRVEQAIVKLVTGEPTMCHFDKRDLRSVPKSDRVPRCLEAPLSPIGYWNISSPGRVKSIGEL